MSFLSHKITAFDKPVSSLPDEPNLSAEELKRCFDSSPEQLRQSVNGLCDEAEALNTRVEGIVAETYEDTIHESMLDIPLQTKINGKADEAANTAAHTALETAVARKCEVYFGSYVGDGANERTITLDFPLKGVLIFNQDGLTGWYDSGYYCHSGGMAFPDHPCEGIAVSGNNFTLFDGTSRSDRINDNGGKYNFLAFR